MKPRIDPSDPRVGHLLEVVRARSTTAYNESLSMDDAVRPVYATPAFSDRPVQIGSCVLVRFGGQVFALSASHVFDQIKYEVLIGCGNKLHALSGDRFSSARGPSGTHQDDVIDASVFHITSGPPPEIAASALTDTVLDGGPPARQEEFFVAMGYRNSQSATTLDGVANVLDRYPSMEWSAADYAAEGLDIHHHCALACEDRVVVDGRWRKAPTLRGLSGGAIVRIAGLPVDPRKVVPEDLSVKLTAITTERRSDGKDRLGVLVGTRIGIHFGLIKRYLPELFND